MSHEPMNPPAGYPRQLHLHERENVPTSDATWPIDRYRVPGGWLYHARAVALGDGACSMTVALAFVPDPPEPTP